MKTSEEDQAPPEDREKTGEDGRRPGEDGRRRRRRGRRTHRGFSKPPPVPRCRRCQFTDHDTADCSSKSKACAVCAEPHESQLCFDRLDRGEVVARRCAVCGASGHSAPSLYCPLRTKPPAPATKTTPSRTSDDDADRPHAPDRPRRKPRRRVDVDTVSSPRLTRRMAQRRADARPATPAYSTSPERRPLPARQRTPPPSTPPPRQTQWPLRRPLPTPLASRPSLYEARPARWTL
jgi:hypothetical protein